MLARLGISSLVFWILGFSNPAFARVGAVDLTGNPNTLFHTYSATVTADHPEDLQEFRNCVQYEVCAVTHSKFSKQGEKFEMEVTPFSEGQFDQITDHCPLKDFKSKVTFFDENGNEVDATPVRAAYDSYYEKRKIQILSDADAKTILGSLNTLNQLLNDSSCYDEVLDDTEQLVHFDLMGYKPYYSSKDQFAGAVTDHDEKTIMFTKKTFNGLEACQLVGIFRHEVDHVHQVARVNECNKLGTPTDLDNHNQRELSAHLNDILNQNKYCPNPAWNKRHIRFLLDRAKNYIHQMGAGVL